MQQPCAGAGSCGSAGTWAGPYAGAQLVGSLSSVSSSEYIAASGALFHHYDTLVAGGGLGGNFGYNWLPWNRWWLLGVVAHLNYQDESGGKVQRTRDHVTGSGQLKVGLLPKSNLLCFVQTGPAFARERTRVDFGGSVTSQDRSVPGYMLGAGVEWALPPTTRVVLGWQRTLFIEFQHDWWSSNSLEKPPAVPTLDLHWHRESEKILAGLRLYF